MAGKKKLSLNGDVRILDCNGNEYDDDDAVELLPSEKVLYFLLPGETLITGQSIKRIAQYS